LPVAAAAHGARAPEPFDDLPAVARRTSDFPEISRSNQPADLPVPVLARQAADLPSVKPAVPARRAPQADIEVDFPDIPRGSLEADLPSPSRGVDLPSLSPGVGLPARSPSRGFGEIDLPIVSAELPDVGAQAPDVAAELPVPSQDDPFGALPRVAHGGGGSPSDDPFGAAEKPDPFGATAAGAAAFEGTHDPFGQGLPDPFAGSVDPFGAPSDGSDAPDPRVVRQSGAAYGEVNLGDGDAESMVALDRESVDDAPVGEEFSGLPTDVAAPTPQVQRPRPAAAPGSAVAEIQAKRRRRRLRIVVGAIVVGALGGGALTLVPTLGPFGAYFVIDQLRHGEYERLLKTAGEGAQQKLANDTYPDSTLAIEAVDASAAQARRFKPLAAYSSFLRFARLLRFGQETEVYARAKVSLEELADVVGVEKVDLARAAKAAADGQLARARQELEGFARSNPRDPDIAAVRGEVELHARDAKAAIAAWTAVGALEKSARAAFGLARASQLSGDAAAAQKYAQEALRLNPRHVGARLLLAEDAWTVKRDEGAATKLLEGVLAKAGESGPEERIFAGTLFGEIHLNRGRVSQAEQAFNDAIKIAEGMKSSAKGARALSGLGEALFRAGRYSQAQADFKRAAQADPDYVAAQVGLAKSSLELERVDEAKEMLVKLRKAYPADVQVAYWYGRVNESLGDRKEAEVAFRDAITAGKDDPDTIQAYIALARVQSQQGMLDAANTTLSDAQKRLPASPALFKALGRVAMTQGRYQDAQAAFDQALTLDAGDLEAKFLVGTALVREHQFEKALEIFDAVGKVDRDLPGLALERGILFQEAGRTEEALREYEGALAKAPNDPDLMLKVGCGKADAGSGDESEKLLRKVLGQRPNSAETHYCLGRALMAKVDFAEALKEFSRAVQLDPNHAEYHLYVGWAANEMGQLAKAQASLKKALDLDQGLADAYWQRGVLRLRETRARDAVEDLMKALQLRPSRFEAHADLALAYYDLGKEDLALGEWQKAIAADANRAEWRYHYGKLLNLHLQSAAAAEQLKKAIDLVVAKGQSPVWLSEAHRLCALSLGSSPAAVPHWQAFLKMGAADSPFRAEAKAALKRLGAPWEE
jgi:tetratricopeptide (TPR) repeat protein